MIRRPLFLTRLQLLLLLFRHQAGNFLFRFLADLVNLLFLLLIVQRAVRANGLDLRMRICLNGFTLVDHIFGDAGLLPARLLMDLNPSRALCPLSIGLRAARCG
jgi:hypothetical protein